MLTNTVAIASMGLVILGTVTNVWLRGKWGLTLVLCSVATSIGAMVTSYWQQNGGADALSIGIGAWFFFACSFAFGTKYVMRSKWLEPVSFEAFRSHVVKEGLSGPLVAILTVLGPGLTVATFLLLGILIVLEAMG